MSRASSPSISIKRRGFLAAGIGGVAVSFLSGCSFIPPIPKRPDPKLDDALGWIRLTPQGQFELLRPRMEMGQNILTSLRALAALELGVEARTVLVRLPTTSEINRAKATVGSYSIRELALPLSQACYALRQELMTRAALRLGAAPVRFQGGRVMAATSAAIELRELALPALKLEAPDVSRSKLKFYQRDESSVPGTADQLGFAQEEALLRGQALYAGDIRLPDMLYAVVLRSPWPDQKLTPTQLLTWDEQAVRQVLGFHSVVKHALLAGPALVATRISALDRMREAANAKWASPATPQIDPMSAVDIDTVIAGNSFTKSSGNTQVPDPAALRIRVDVPLASHAFIEPRCAVAHFEHANRLEIWCGTQDAFYIRDVMQRDHDLPLEQITVQPMRIGGAFGGKTIATVEREAAVIAKATGKAVKVQWSRADEFQAAFHRQPSSHRIQVQLEQGRITDWRHSLSTSHVLFTNAIAPPWLQRLTNVVLGDDGAARGQLPVYGFERQRLDLQLTRLPVLTGPWRGLGAGPNVLAIEVAMDRAAIAAKAEPVAFRLQHLRQALAGKAGDPQRVAQCLEKLVELMKRDPLALGSKRVAAATPTRTWFEAEGVACGAYKGMSYAAASAQVRVRVDAEGKLIAAQILKIWCTHDCGRMVDPDGVHAQVQGNLVWCIGMVLKEAITAPKGYVQETSLAQQNLPRIKDVPPISIFLLPSAQDPTGAGETAMVAGAGAIANAVLRALDLAGVKPQAHLRFPLSV